jgi:molybdopterin guanine dinucleotide-containing S/N-oxide reductase-like protein
MSSDKTNKVVYVSHPGSGLGRSNFPLETQVSGSKIVRSRPFFIPDDVNLYEIKTSKGNFSRSRKEVQMPLAFAAKRRVYSDTRVKYPLLRDDWSPDKTNADQRGRSGYSRISWDQALDIVVGQIKRVREKYGSMEPILVQADGHGQSGYLHSLHFWGHYLFDKINEKLGWGWWCQQMRNPDSWEGYYWGAKHVWGFDESLGEPFQDAVWDDVLEHAEMVIFSGNDPEATGFGMSGSIALDMPKWLKRAGIKIVAISPDLNYACAVHADKWIPLKPNTDAALYLALAHTWIVEGRYDKEYVASHTVGFEEFERHVLGKDDGLPKTPAWAEKITGIPAHTIRALAREWREKRTTLSVYFGGPKVRGTHSHLVTRLEAYALAMQGIGKPGRQFLRTGAPSFYKKSIAQVPRHTDVDRKGMALSSMLEYALGKAPKSNVFVPRTLVTEAIKSGSVEWRGTTAALAKTEDQFKQFHFPPRPDHPGIRMVWNENGSQPGSWGSGWAWLEALRNPKIDFVLGVHPWLENDIMFSDLILPAQTSYEHEDIITAQRCDILGLFYQEQAIEPVGESKSDYDIHRLIAQRLGLDEDFPPGPVQLKTAYETTLAFTKHGISWEDFKARKYIVYDCPTWDEWLKIKKEHGFGPTEGGMSWYWNAASGLETPSGKIEFVSSLIAEKDPNNQERPPLAKWVTHPEMLSSPHAKEYPLVVISNHPRFRFHVQGDDIDWIKEIAKVRGPDGYMYEPCWIHPNDAQARGISNGDILVVNNDRGGVLVGAVITERIIPGAVSIDHGAKIDLALLKNKLIDRGGCINLISPSPEEKYGRGAEVTIPEMNVTGFLVEVGKVDASDIQPYQGPALGSKLSA